MHKPTNQEVQTRDSREPFVPDPHIVRADFVLATLDSEMSAAVRALWAQLSDRGIKTPIDDGDPPHLSLGGAEGLDLSRLQPLLDQLSPCLDFQIRFSHVGAFGGGSYLWLGVNPSEQLQQLHRAVHETLLQSTGEVPDPMYSPRNWIPHTTIAKDVSPAAMKAFWEVARAFDLSRPVTITGLALTRVEYPRS